MSNYDLGGRRLVGRTEATRTIVEAELLRFLLIGFTLKECCQQMKCAYGTVRKVARSPEFLVKLREQSNEIAERLTTELASSQVDFARKLEEASEAALEEMLAMMGEIPNASALKYKICQDLLDRDARASRTKRLEANTNMTHDFISPAILIHAAATAKELERFQPKLIEGKDGVDPGHTPDS